MRTDLAAAALWYAERLRWPVFPVHGIRDGRCTCSSAECKSPGKHPRTDHGVLDATLEPAVIQRWWAQWPDSNVGLATGERSGVDVLDVDPRHYGDESLWNLERKHTEIPPTVISLTGGGGSHIFFQHAPGLRNVNGEIGEGLDLKTTNAYVVLPPSNHASGRPYIWEGASRPNEIMVAAFPVWLSSLAMNGNGNGAGGHKSASAVDDNIPSGKRNTALTSLAGSMRRRGMAVEEILIALEAVNRRRCNPPLVEEEVRRIAESVGRYAPGQSGTADGRRGAKQKQSDAAASAEADGATSTPAAPEFSEDALAARFTAQHREDLRYVAKWGRWLQWDGRRWAQDETLHVFDRAREICRAASTEGGTTPTVATRMASAATVAAVERLVRADRQHAAVIDQWDADPWLLNTPGGIIDLRTGAIEVHRRDAYCTKMTAVAPGGDYPLWNAFLDRITDGDHELRAFLQRMVGYSLTGDTREHALFFLYGTGANGKSVFLNTVAATLADYAKVAAIETFIVSSAEHHPTDMAGLQGARLVTATETEDGRRWAESKIKALTGGERISARFMRQDFFEFTPVFKLMIAGNHKPGLRSVDEAIRRRLHLVPFTVMIPARERDLSLRHKLQCEWPGILAWAVEGCLAWQARGLDPPACVRDATEQYMAAEDALSEWIDTRCVRLPNVVNSVARLFADWKTWAEAAEEFVGSQKRFSQALEERGFTRTRDNRGARAFQGIAIRVEPSREEI